METSIELVEGDLGMIRLPVANGKHVFMIVSAKLLSKAIRRRGDLTLRMIFGYDIYNHNESFMIAESTPHPPPQYLFILIVKLSEDLKDKPIKMNK